MWLASGGEATYVVEMREWVSAIIEFWSWSNLTRCFPVLHNFFRGIVVIRHSHLIHSWVLSFCDFWIIDTSTLYFQSLPWHWLTIISGLRVINENQKFSLQNVFIGVIGASCKLWGKFFMPWKDQGKRTLFGGTIISTSEFLWYLQRGITLRGGFLCISLL